MVTPMVVHSALAEESKSVVQDVKMAASSEGGAAVVLHPLVVINISDHHTRFEAMRLFPEATARNACRSSESAAVPLTDESGNVRVVGILLGEQDGRTVEVCHSFELSGRVLAENKSTQIDVEFMQQRIEQYKQIFPRYAVVGWYSTATSVNEDDLRLHTDVFSVLNESPVLLVINPSARFGADLGPGSNAKRVSTSSGQTAIVAYQTELHMDGEEFTKTFAPVPHRFASADSERIAVDHVTRHAIPGGGDSVSSTVVHLTTLRRSILMLESRVNVIVRFLEATASGEIAEDHELLRKVYGVCARLPAMNSVQFTRAFEGEYNDSMVVSYLSGVTKSLCAMNDLVGKFNLAYEKPSSSEARRKGPYLL